MIFTERFSCSPLKHLKFYKMTERCTNKSTKYGKDLSKMQNWLEKLLLPFQYFQLQDFQSISFYYPAEMDWILSFLFWVSTEEQQQQPVILNIIWNNVFTAIYIITTICRPKETSTKHLCWNIQHWSALTTENTATGTSFNINR